MAADLNIFPPKKSRFLHDSAHESRIEKTR